MLACACMKKVLLHEPYADKNYNIIIIQDCKLGDRGLKNMTECWWIPTLERKIWRSCANCLVPEKLIAERNFC